jgi:hypothetical protein
MIYFVSHASHMSTVAVVLLWYGQKVQPFFRFVPYQKLFLLRGAGPGVVIWCDFDRVPSADLELAAQLRGELKQRELVHLNDPSRSEQRFELLRRLHREGINAFDVRRPDESFDGLRYPVFLRDEVGATYRRPTLLPDRASLAAAVAGLPNPRMIKPMIVEFGAKPGADGFFRKFGAYRVGEQIFPQHCFISPNWFVKHAPMHTPEHLAEHVSYVEQNPHAAELRSLFDGASIEYGRIDYTVVDGRIQVFEINTNPSVISHPPKPSDTFDQTPYAESYVDALLKLKGAQSAARHEAIDANHEFCVQRLREWYRFGR